MPPGSRLQECSTQQRARHRTPTAPGTCVQACSARLVEGAKWLHVYVRHLRADGRGPTARHLGQPGAAQAVVGDQRARARITCVRALGNVT